MIMNKRIWIPAVIFLVLVGVLFYFFFLKASPDKKIASDKTLESFRSMLSPVKLEELNIILFTIDTLRADHLECYGYNSIKTPHINRLADEGILFEHNIVQAPLTLPSHSSILTGTYPLYHGIRDNGGFYLDESHVTLAEELKSRGYATGAFVAAFVLDSKWGLDQGFDYYYDNFDLTKYKKVSLDSVQRRGDEVLSEAYKWFEENDQDKFFAWIHLYDPHTPYDPPEPYKTDYAGRRFSLYDGEIAYVDQLIGEFRQFMEEKNLLEKTLIIFTSDHGESLGEHKENAHGFFIYDSAVRVPLIVRLPGKKKGGQRIANQVRSIDIMPTILNCLDNNPSANVQGQSLLPYILDLDGDLELSAYSETYWPNYHYGWSELKSLRKGQYKFIEAPKPELYDVFKDPGERENLINRMASLGHEMQRNLNTLMENYSAADIDEVQPQRVDDDTLTKLQALGYLGSFRTSPRESGERLADPKDKIELYNEIKVAQFLVTEEKMEQAEQKIKKVLNKDSSVLEARYILGNIFTKQEKFEEAIAEYQKALAVEADYYDAIFGLALAYKKSGREDDAIIGFQRLMELDNRDTKPLLHLSDIYLQLGQFDDALTHLKSASEIDPESPIFHNRLGAVYLKMEMLDLAEKEIKEAMAIERSVPLLNAHFNMALLHEARGELDQAVLEYKKEQETSPFNFQADFNLGLLYVKTKELDKAIKEFKSSIQKNEEYGSAYVFLAKAYMDTGMDLNEAAQMAEKGISLTPDLKTTVLAHFVLADLYNRLGRYQESQQHVSKAKQLQKSLSQ
jgi:arylsulfatase A-like enzyme/Tfp pilus assembly protein PilF